jgi:hypothetical protein
VQEAAEFQIASSPAAFGDVHWNGTSLFRIWLVSPYNSSLGNLWLASYTFSVKPWAFCQTFSLRKSFAAPPFP